MVLDSQRPYWSKWVRVVCCWFESQPGKTVSVEKENLAELIKLEKVTICSLRLQKVVTSHFLRQIKLQHYQVTFFVSGSHTFINHDTQKQTCTRTPLPQPNSHWHACTHSHTRTLAPYTLIKCTLTHTRTLAPLHTHKMHIQAHTHTASPYKATPTSLWTL